MPAPISVIVPTLNAAEALPGLFASLMEGVAEGVVREVIVSDGGSDDGTKAVAEAVGAHWITGAPGRGGQLARGCRVARGDWLMVLHADTELPGGWSDGLGDALAAPDRAWAFRLAFRAHGLGPRWVAAWANLRSRAFGLPYGDQGLLIARSLYDACGGYPEIPLMEDVALARALRGRLGLLPLTVTTDARRYLAEGWLRRGARNLWTLTRYLAGVRPERLVRGYSGGRDET